MTRDQSYSGMLGMWQRLLAALRANTGDLGHLEGSRTKLEGLFTQAVEVVKQQAALKASKQETTQQIKQLVGEGRRLADLLRTGVKENYGPKSEKLVEFGLQPFRGRKVKPLVGGPGASQPAKAPATPSTPTNPEPPSGHLS